MGLYDTVRYKRNFLDQVIVKIDFRQYIDSEIIFGDKIENVISKRFPHKGKKEIIRFNSVNIILDNMNAKKPDASAESVEGLLAEYFTSSLKNKLVLTNRSIAIEFKEYMSFEELRGCIDKILYEVFSLARQLSVVRAGIRYINLFEPQQIKLQKKYFSREISPTFLTKVPSVSGLFLPIRHMHMTEYREGNKFLNFRYGMYNPDYPNELKKNSFVLDFDCYTYDIMEDKNDVLCFLCLGHDGIQLLFEESITDALRGVMNHE